MINHDISVDTQLMSLLIIDKLKNTWWVIVLQPYSMVAQCASILD